MNIFYLDDDVKMIAKYHCDKHVVKMIVETAQMLSTAHHILDGPYDEDSGFMKKTHHKHPCSKWIRAASGNYIWAVKLFEELCAEYSRRYGRVHKSYTDRYDKIKNLPVYINTGDFTTPPQCMPDDYKHADTIIAYRQFYNYDKARFAKWKYTEEPHWFRNLYSEE